MKYTNNFVNKDEALAKGGLKTPATANVEDEIATVMFYNIKRNVPLHIVDMQEEGVHKEYQLTTYGILMDHTVFGAPFED